MNGYAQRAAKEAAERIARNAPVKPPAPSTPKPEPVVPGRQQGKRMTSKDEPLTQLAEIEKAQRKVRQGKSKQIIDNIEKSEQRAKNRLKDIARDPDCLDDLD